MVIFDSFGCCFTDSCIHIPCNCNFSPVAWIADTKSSACGTLEAPTSTVHRHSGSTSRHVWCDNSRLSLRKQGLANQPRVRGHLCTTYIIQRYYVSRLLEYGTVYTARTNYPWNTLCSNE
ncbi:hypothetical protein M404DRAFT_799079 [Pisolithus tinctorius Marx 270]|uniref:Uncharacterized protein n=1 Tax=Pisolithus tinctorius Marx 270 TaxID=870435 RepID=A0A0C3PT09_PISTI|nr:hypothetical protein M404DRAFT_799079 [Pisolithus tinctorius Marx 270]